MIGACTPPGGPTMLQQIGAVTRDSCFFLRDNTPDAADYGLLHDKLWTFYVDPVNACPLGGELANKQGMIMIR